MAIIPHVHLAVTCMMAGLIWFVQLVHYPLMSHVGRDGFAAYEQDHTRRIRWIVAPCMLVEAATGLCIALWRPTSISPALVWTALALLAVIWLSTAVLQMPCHRRLLRGFDRDTWQSLVRSNWIRTVAWSGRTVLAVAMVA